MTDSKVPAHTVTNRQIELIVRQEWGRVLAALIRRLGQLELAEDALQDAFLTALSYWRAHGVPDNTKAWLLRTAEHKAIDIIRRARVFATKQQQMAVLSELEAVAEQADYESPFPDERLQLIFTCCHPALAHEASVALSLKTICGLNTAQIARAFLVSDSTMAQRIVRAKRKISVAGIPYVIPAPDLWGKRMQAVLSVIYFIFNEGYAASDGAEHSKTDLCEEAIRLGRIVAELAPNDADAAGLLALMLLHHSRRNARRGRDGEIIALEFQDRSVWDNHCITEGLRYLARSNALSPPGQYALQAGLSAVHARANCFAETEWTTIVGLYDQLNAAAPSPVLLLNRAVALSFVDGPKVGLEALKELEIEPRLAKYQPYHAARADMLARKGCTVKARAAYGNAIALTDNEAERRFLERKRDFL